MSTQVFILCDKPEDATFILISFRGTEPFDADDWSTDFDYSWYEIPGLGKLHMGFLEALGLGNRTYTPTFQHNLANKSTISSTPDMAELTAYNAVTTKLQALLQEHKNAKFVVTGHSLGAALAILYPTVLILRDESAMMQRLSGVYTFGQPRIADRDLGRYIDARLNTPDELRYFRVVYCNDVVPRLPYDNNTFLYKHFGVCLYYNSFYSHKEVEEEPNKNFYGIRYLIPAHMNALWELIRAFAMKYVYGAGYEEDWYSIFVRVVGLVLPGISAHSPRDYVNSVRLGNVRDYAVQMHSID
ncbi:unnamed protein product [Amaranthus hypochondriacus]